MISCMFHNTTWHLCRGDFDSNCVRVSGHVNAHTCHCMLFLQAIDINVEVCPRSQGWVVDNTPSVNVQEPQWFRKLRRLSKCFKCSQTNSLFQGLKSRIPLDSSSSAFFSFDAFLSSSLNSTMLSENVRYIQY